jgi:hypothetical protein
MESELYQTFYTFSAYELKMLYPLAYLLPIFATLLIVCTWRCERQRQQLFIGTLELPFVHHFSFCTFYRKSAFNKQGCLFSWIAVDCKNERLEHIFVVVVW